MILEIQINLFSDSSLLLNIFTFFNSVHIYSLSYFIVTPFSMDEKILKAILHKSSGGFRNILKDVKKHLQETCLQKCWRLIAVYHKICASWTLQFEDKFPARGQVFGHCRQLNRLCPNSRFNCRWYPKICVKLVLELSSLGKTKISPFRCEPWCVYL